MSHKKIKINELSVAQGLVICVAMFTEIINIFLKLPASANELEVETLQILQ